MGLCKSSLFGMHVWIRSVSPSGVEASTYDRHLLIDTSLVLSAEGCAGHTALLAVMQYTLQRLDTLIAVVMW